MEEPGESDEISVEEQEEDEKGEEGRWCLRVRVEEESK